MSASCTVEGCELPLQARGFCMNHYAKARRNGMGRVPRHYLTEVDRIAALATCAICGPGTPVRALNQSPNGQCANFLRERSKEYYASRIEQRRKYHREYAVEARGRIVRELLDAAGWLCEICDTPIDEATARIDHDHACCPTNRVGACGDCYRGALCNGCNIGLGMFRDEPAILARAIHYLALQTGDDS